MKYIVIVPDGMADYPVEELGNKTPLQVAHATNMDHLAKQGFCGLVQTIPAGMPPGSDVGNLSLLGYDPKKYLTGRAALEAASMGIELAADEIAFRCNLVTVENNKMSDYSAGHISSKEAAILVDSLNKELGSDTVKFYPGKSYRHILVIKSHKIDEFKKIKTVPPHDIAGKDIKGYLPHGKQSEQLLKLMEHSKKIFEDHSVNRVRVDLKENPATMIWLWGQGTRPQLPAFKEKYGISGAIISAVDLVTGIGRLTGLEVLDVPGITGYYDTNYAGKAQYGLAALKNHDFVFIHIEAPDEAGHNGDAKAKMSCIEKIDREIVGAVINHFDGKDDVRIMVLPDHPTPVSLRTHTNEPVGFVIFGKGITPNGAAEFSEPATKEKGLKFKSGEELMEFFLKKHL